MTNTFYSIFGSGLMLQWLCFREFPFRYTAKFISFLTILMNIQVFLFIPRAIGLVTPSKALNQIIFNVVISINCFYSGCFISALVITNIKLVKLKTLVHEYHSRFVELLRWLKIVVVSFFLYSSLAACFYYRASLQFFRLSGYPESFMITIITLEFLAPLALLFRKTALYGSILLITDMCGAVSTHYVNYYHHLNNKPLVSSIPALVILPVLLTIVTLRDLSFMGRDRCISKSGGLTMNDQYLN